MKKDFRTKNILSDLVLWPRFEEYDDCIFLAQGFSIESYQHSVKFAGELGRGKMTVESMMNSVLVFECFLNAPAKVTPRLAREACEVIRDCWRMKLRLDFPDRRFKIVFSPDHPPEWYGVSFYQPKHKS